VLAHEYQIMHELEMGHWWFCGRRQVLIDLLMRHLPLASRPRLLDLGCGTGGNIGALARLGDVIGIEPDPSAVALARTRGGAVFCRATGTALPFAAGSFDGVIASDVLEHIGEDVSAVAEISRVLRPGGLLVFSVPAHPWLFAHHDAALLHHRRYTRQSIQRVIRRGGLTIRWLSFWNTILFPIVCAYRLIGKLRGDTGVQSDIRTTPRLLNETLASVLHAEARVLRHTRLPWGVSLVGVATRS
jgi:SAM-dependent methyltransferase